jgi:hypothetical protein
VLKLSWILLLVVATGWQDRVAAAPAADGTAEADGNTEFDWAQLIMPPLSAGDGNASNAFGSYAEALANGSAFEAEVIAKQMVESASAGDSGGIERARALQNLAVAQQLLGENASARQNYMAAIAEVSNARDNLSPELIMPLRGLASAFVESRQPTQAFAALDRALHVSNVNYGPHSLDQLPILDARMRLYLDLEDTGSALDMLDRIYMLYTRKYDRYSTEMLPALYLKADITSRLDLIGEERETWRHILAIKENSLDELDPGLIDPNVRLAWIYVRSMRKDSFRSIASSDAERHLKAALRIAEKSPQSSWEMRRDCLLSLADFYTLFDLKARARRYYARAWKLLSSDEAYLAAREESFASPVPLARPRPDRYAHIEIRPDSEQVDDDDYLEGEVTVLFDVDERGRTQDLRVVAARPEKFTRMEIRATNAVENFVYRPRFVDGEPVDTRGLSYRFRYLYLQDVYESALEKSAKRNRTDR